LVDQNAEHTSEAVFVGERMRSYHLPIFSFSFHCIFMSLIARPNQSPEPMRGGAVSSASRLDVIWSRMAQLRMLDSRAERFFFQRVFAALLAMRLRAEEVSFLARAFPPRLENSAWFIWQA
jgi:hypothetical protein